jgi:hypothetical protein
LCFILAIPPARSLTIGAVAGDKGSTLRPTGLFGRRCTPRITSRGSKLRGAFGLAGYLPSTELAGVAAIHCFTAIRGSAPKR